MFNLLVAFDGTAWETDQLMRVDADRFKEFSGNESKAISLDQHESLKTLEEITTLLMYESGATGEHTERVRIGHLREIRQSEAHVVFRFRELGYLEREVIHEFASRLAIHQFEFSRTHWAVKDGDLPTVMLEKMTLTSERRHEVILLVHGIRSFATWQKMVKRILGEIPNTTVIPISYRYFDAFRFWCPMFTRDFAISKIRRQIQAAKKANPDANLSVIAHSFGTYAITKILLEHPDINLHRLILSGSIVPQAYRWDYVDTRLPTGVLNDYGTRDIWPVLAQCLSWGYGDTGRHGFGISTTVIDRGHDYSHSQFFNEAFVIKYWKPWFEYNRVVKSEWEEPTPAWWLGVLSILPLQWGFVCVMLAVILWLVLTVVPSFASIRKPVSNGSDQPSPNIVAPQLRVRENRILLVSQAKLWTQQEWLQKVHSPDFGQYIESVPLTIIDYEPSPTGAEGVLWCFVVPDSVGVGIAEKELLEAATDDELRLVAHKWLKNKTYEREFSTPDGEAYGARSILVALPDDFDDADANRVTVIKGDPIATDGPTAMWLAKYRRPIDRFPDIVVTPQALHEAGWQLLRSREIPTHKSDGPVDVEFVPQLTGTLAVKITAIVPYPSYMGAIAGHRVGPIEAKPRLLRIRHFVP